MEESQTKTLFLTPRKVEAGTELRPGVAVSKEIGNCTSAKIAENAHWTPKPRRLQAAAVAKREKRVVFQNVVGKKLLPARSRNRSSNVQNKLVLILDTRRQTAAARHDIRSHSRCEEPALSKVVCEFHFPYVCPHGPLREPEVPSQGSSLVSAPGLEMIVKVVISADLEAGSNKEPASNAQDLTTFEIPNS